MTKIQKTEGDLEALKSDLAKALNLETSSKKAEVTINSTTGHIIVKVCWNIRGGFPARKKHLR